MAELSQELKDMVAGRLEEIVRRHAELERMLADPDLATNPSRYATLAKEHGALAKYAEMRRSLEDAQRRRREAQELAADAGEDKEMRELAAQEAAEAEQAEQRILDELLGLLLDEPGESQRNVIMEVRAGTGGEEAALFASELFRMYSRYAQRKGWRVEVLDQSQSDLGGFKEIIFSVSGPGAWQALRYESGGHRVQRVPVTEAQGRIHTSLATVAVLPEAEEVDMEVNPEDLEITTMASGGPGGQCVNKVASSVRIVHKPTGLTVRCQEQRSQHQNRRIAMTLLRTKLYEMHRTQEKAKRDEMRRTLVGSGDRNERIRTYNFPQDRVTDHRIGLTVHGIQNMLMGDCDEFLSALAEWDKAERIKSLTKA